jgi:dynein heavy chain
MVDNGGWYDTKEKDWHGLVDVQLLCAMGPPGGGRNSITPRMMRHFSILCVSDFSSSDIKQIFLTIVDWNMKRFNFPKDLASLSASMVNATLRIYQEAQKVLLPTPKKSHYTFNLRDFSRIIQGFCLVEPYEGLDKFGMMRLWTHESSRVIMDRLMEESDKELFMNSLGSVVEENFQTDLDTLIGFLDPEADPEVEGSGKGSLSAHRRLFFGNYLDMNAAVPKYVEVEDVDGLVTTIEQNLELYNQESKSKMDW